MEYEFPMQGFEKVTDQFMLGHDILVSPMLDKGKTERLIRFPAGVWVSETGETITGLCDAIVDAPLNRLPRYKLVQL